MANSNRILASALVAFSCHRCGNCCRGDGVVVMYPRDIRRAALYLDMTEEAFLAEYGRPVPDGGHVLRDQGDALRSCIFLTPDNGCRIHEAKPQQCRDFPRKWRPPNVLDYCAGLRAAANLGPPDKDVMTIDEKEEQ